VSPAAVTPAHVVIMRGNADGCPVGGAVTIVSSAGDLRAGAGRRQVRHQTADSAQEAPGQL
jgi:hypothetical protein